MNAQALELERIEVLARIRAAAGRHAEVIAELVALLAHAKAIVAAEALGHGSLFDYCRRALNLSRDQAYRYLACADVITKQPQVLDALKTSRLNATGVATLAAYVKANNVEDGARALARAEGKTVEAIELLVAELCPKPDVKFSVRPAVSYTSTAPSELLDAATIPPSHAIAMSMHAHVIAESMHAHAIAESMHAHVVADQTREQTVASAMRAQAPAELQSPSHPPAKAVPLSLMSYKMTLTLSAEAYNELQELRDIVSHIIPSGRLDKVLTHSISIALKQARKAKWKTAERPAATAGVSVTAPDVAAARTESHDGAAADATAPLATSAMRASNNGVAETQASAGGMRRSESHGRRVDQTTARHPSDPLRRAVYLRDGGRCAFVGMDGRCDSTWQVEVDHIIRVADGGATTLGNLRLCCRRHNQAREVAA